MREREIERKRKRDRERERERDRDRDRDRDREFPRIPSLMHVEKEKWTCRVTNACDPS
jgi:hypothetical protein